MYIWWAQTIDPKKPIAIIAKTIPNLPKIGLFEKVETTWLITPKAGKIEMCTSGCPKNQNKCWYKITSPPPDGSKKEVLKYDQLKA